MDGYIGPFFNLHFSVKLDKNLLTLWMNSDRTVKSVIVEIQEKNQGPPIYDHRLMYKEVSNFGNFY